MSEAERAKMMEQMRNQMLDQAGLTDAEKAAAKKTLKAKSDAMSALRAEHQKLQRAGSKAKATDKELRAALAAYQKALGQYRQKIAAEDRVLAGKLSLKSQVKAMSLGILDNGMRMGMGGMRGGGMRGGTGGDMRGGRGG